MIMKSKDMATALIGRIIGVESVVGEDGQRDDVVSIRITGVTDPVVRFHVEREIADSFREMLGRNVSLPIHAHLRPIEMFTPATGT